MAFPLLGMEVSLPDDYAVAQAGSTRVTLFRGKNAIRVSLYRVEFGNLEKLTTHHEVQMFSHLRQRLGRQGTVALTPMVLSGRQARQVVMTGKRGGSAWGIQAAWVLRGGQASVVEVIYPLAQRPEAQELFATLCRGLVWLSPERG